MPGFLLAGVQYQPCHYGALGLDFTTPGQANAELFVNLGAKPGYSKYTYPHPLRFTQ